LDNKDINLHLHSWNQEMGSLGFFNVEANSFEFLSEISGGIRLEERGGGIFRVVVLGWPSVFWLLKALEVMTKGNDLREYWRTAVATGK
jgi:hypothetical protein